MATEATKVGAANLFDGRFFGFIWKVINGVDFGLHVGKEAIETAAFSHFDRRLALTLAGLAKDLHDAIHRVDRVLDPLADTVFDIVRRCAWKQDHDFQLVGLDAGERFTLQRRSGQCTDGKERDHQQVRDGRMLGEELDHC